MSDEPEPAERPAPAPAPPPSWKRHLRFRWSLLILLTVTVGTAIGVVVRQQRGRKAWARVKQATISGDTETVKWCIDIDPSLIEHQFPGGQLLHYACRGGDVDMAALLIQRGADVSGCSSVGAAPLHEAVSSFDNRAALVRMLIEAGADATPVMSMGETPLHTVCTFNDRAEALEVAQTLIDAGADVNAKDMWGNTPLHELTGGLGELDVMPDSAELKLAKLLIDHGADWEVKNGEGKSPKDLCDFQPFHDYVAEKRTEK